MAHKDHLSAERLLTFFSSACIASLLTAQGLGQQDLLPPIGSTWHMRALQVVPAEELPIEPIVWPYADLVGNDLFGASYEVLTPQQVPGSGAYPGVDRVLRMIPDNNGSRTHTFYEVQPKQCVELGSADAIQTVTYSQPGQAYAYPLGAEETIEGSFCYSTTSASATTEYCGTTRISLDATGTLELSFGTFSNVQMVTTRRAFVQLATEDDSTILETRDWYAQGVPYPLMHTTKLTLPDGSVTRLGQVLDPTSVVGLEEQYVAAPLSVYPNPSEGKLALATGGDGGQLEVIGADGRLIHAERIAEGRLLTEVDLTGLPNGVYHLALRGVGSVRAAMVVVAH